MTTAPKSMWRAVILYAAACVVVIGLAGGVFTVVFGSPSERSAIWIGALVALVVQVGAFTIARGMVDVGRGIAGWGLGALICFVALIVFGFASRALGLPSNAALLSLATYFFLTELIEPPLLNV
ncbi:MAG: hypothetical protein M3Z05_12365 [Gemmatimonadota bacterium]|nr:hypothetical protein [Gemmatimonadota bacterium]